MDVQTLAEEKVKNRARARTDALYLANEVLGYDFCPSVHQELFDIYPTFDGSKSWSEQIEGKRDLMVLWSRGHFKSTAVKVKLIQAILCNPDITILVMQGSIAVTQLFMGEILKHFTGEASGSKLQELFPDFCGTKKQLQATSMHFTVPCRIKKQIPQPTIAVASPKAIKTGQHYDLAAFDDLQNESNSHSPKLLAKVQTDFQGCQPLVQNGARWVSGTRWAFGDLYEQIIRWDKNNKWVTSIKDCWKDDKTGVRFPKYTKKDGQVGGFTREELLELQDQDPAFFACQYLNQPVHDSKQTITKEEMEDACIAADSAPMTSMPIIVCDLASTDNVKSDDSVIMVGRLDTLGVGYLCDLRGDQWNPMDLALNVIDMALKYRPVKILFEKTASCIYFVEFLKQMAKTKNILLPIDYIKVDNKADAKNIRVTSWASHVKRGRFQFFKGLPKWQRLVDQTCQFPKGRYGHDDYPDTAALLYQQLSSEFMALPMRPRPVNPILAIIADRENALVKVLTQDEQLAMIGDDQTGLD